MLAAAFIAAKGSSVGAHRVSDEASQAAATILEPIRSPPKRIALTGHRPYLDAMALFHRAVPVLLLLAGCGSEALVPSAQPQPTPTAGTSALDPGTTPVRIAESGPAFDACAIRAVVTDPGGATVPIRAAPFAAGAELARLGNGTRLYVCTRTIDQRWLGVVVNPAAAGPDDCGLQARIDRPTDYAGPCQAGWVARGMVRLTAG